MIETCQRRWGTAMPCSPNLRWGSDARRQEPWERENAGGLAPGAPAAGDAAAGKELYTALCARCHGESGRGDGPAGALLETKPRDFTDCARMQAISDQELVAVIREGGPARHLSKDMPPWG